MKADAKKAALHELAGSINSRKGCWLFPQQGSVQGFIGTDPVFLVGDQPSMSPWPPEHPNRKFLYGLLHRLGLANAHLTDIYKRRGGCGALREGLPEDFHEHVSWFREEIELLQPTCIIALGNLAFELLDKHVPECKPMLKKVWHFAYAARYGKLSQYEADLVRAVVGHRPVGQSPKPCASKENIPVRTAKRSWTLRADNGCHHHGVVNLAENPLHLELRWRRTSADSACPVGTFRLDLPALLSGGYVRREHARSEGTHVRLRVVLADDGKFYVQARKNGPRTLLSNDFGPQELHDANLER
jgi:hypothetical protein